MYNLQIPWCSCACFFATATVSNDNNRIARIRVVFRCFSGSYSTVDVLKLVVRQHIAFPIRMKTDLSHLSWNLLQLTAIRVVLKFIYWRIIGQKQPTLISRRDDHKSESDQHECEFLVLILQTFMHASYARMSCMWYYLFAWVLIRWSLLDFRCSFRPQTSESNWARIGCSLQCWLLRWQFADHLRSEQK